MCTTTKSAVRLFALSLAAFLFALPAAHAVDTDIFTGSTKATTPNVLIILDNSSNWNANNQHFPNAYGSGDMKMGQAEVDAIKTVVQSLSGDINVGLMEYATGANTSGGFIRFAVKPISSNSAVAADVATASTNRTAFVTLLGGTNVFAGDQISSAQPYGDLMRDAYNYFAGGYSYAPSAVESTKADTADGYTTPYTRYKSPLNATNQCAHNYIVFIGNAGGAPKNDTTDNLSALQTLVNAANAESAAKTPPEPQIATTTQLPMRVYTESTQTTNTNLGYSSLCYATQPTGTPVDYAASCPTASSNYDSCSYSTTDKTSALATCPTGQLRYYVTKFGTAMVTSAPTVTTSTATGTSSCYPTSSGCVSGDTGGLTCPSNTSSTVGSTTTNTTYSCSYACGSAISGSSSSCPTTTTTTGTATTSTAYSSSCYDAVYSGSGAVGNDWNDTGASGDHGTLTCPASTTTTTNGVTSTTSYSCTYSGVISANTTSCNGSRKHVTVTQTATPTTVTTTPYSKYNVIQTITKSVTTTAPGAGTATTDLGNTSACFSSPPSGSGWSVDYTCPSGYSCQYDTTRSTTGGTCPSGYRYQAYGTISALVTSPTVPATYVTPTSPTYYADEWARFLYQSGAPVTVTSGGVTTTIRSSISTYTIDVYKAQPNKDQSSLLSSMAKAGGGRYFNATNMQAIKDALKSIFSEIQAVNSVFASAALPISATNRAQNDNQVYIGMFRPDQQNMPRWFGNVKRYQIGTLTTGAIDLVDVNKLQVVSPTTGFVTPCAQSYWTVSSGNYWATVDGATISPLVYFTKATTTGTAWAHQGDEVVLAKGGCTTLGAPYSDLPDGPTVEKGGVAQMIRNLAYRNMKTLTGTSSADWAVGTFNTTNASAVSADATIRTNIVNFISGQDVTGEIGEAGGSTAMRPSVHGDVVHSRPLPVDYGGAIGVRVYYGSNDGTFRAVNANNGNEEWAFVAPESYSKLQRLLDNTPLVQSPYPPTPTTTVDAAVVQGQKEYSFDGSTGLYQNADNSQVWIYPTMRRGGRMLYAFDVSTPNTSSTYPTFKWKFGCPNLTDDTGCTSSDAQSIGQTWSTPSVVFLTGEPSTGTTTPVVIMGGGYDTCEDADSNPSAAGFCSGAKGATVYVLNANTGAVLRTFTTERSVASDVALVDINQDGKVDAAYVADTGGAIYRIAFADMSTFVAAPKASWTITKVAYTSGSKRKFLFPPAVLPFRNQVYLAIGSGDREHPTQESYPYTTPVTNRFYVYLDDPTRNTATNMDSTSDMYDKSAISTSCASPGVMPGGSYKGWFMDLTANGTGEQTVTSALISGGMAAFSTNRPIGSTAVCSNSLGEARGYWVNLLNGSGAIGVAGTCGGTRSSTFVGGGLPPSPVTGVVSVDGVTQNVVIGAAQRDGGVSTPIGGQNGDPPINTKRTRIYWRTATDTK